MLSNKYDLDAFHSLPLAIRGYLTRLNYEQNKGTQAKRNIKGFLKALKPFSITSANVGHQYRKTNLDICMHGDSGDR